MKSLKSSKRHHLWKSSIESDFTDKHKNPFYTLESPLKSTKKAKEKGSPIYKTQDNREIIHEEPLEMNAERHGKSKSNNENYESKIFPLKLKIPEKYSLSDLPRKEKPSQNLPALLQDQDEIIKLQNMMITSLQQEVMKFQQPSEDTSNSFNESFLKTQNKKLNKKISQIQERYENELNCIKKGMQRKEAITEEYKIGMEMKLEKKKLKIKMLKGKIEEVKKHYVEFYDKACKNAFEDLKAMLEKEAKDKVKCEEIVDKLREKEKTLEEENNILIQNYEEIKGKYIEIENHMNTIQSMCRKYKIDLGSFHNFAAELEKIIIQNQDLSERVKALSDKNSNLESENTSAKSEIEQKQKSLDSLKLRKPSLEIESLLLELHKNRGKVQHYKIKILELKKMLAYHSQKIVADSSNKDYSLLENQISVLEEELNLLKTQNRILVSKEQDLNLKLSGSERARYYYQEQTLKLKERVNSLENNLRLLEPCGKESKFKEAPVNKLYKNKTVKDLKQAMKN